MSGVSGAVSSVVSGVGDAMGSVAGAAGSVAGGVFEGAKNFVSSDAFKLAALAAGIYITGGLMGAWPTPFVSGTVAPAAGTVTGTTGVGTASQLAASAPGVAAPMAQTAAGDLVATQLAAPASMGMQSALGPSTAGILGEAAGAGLPATAGTTAGSNYLARNLVAPGTPIAGMGTYSGMSGGMPSAAMAAPTITSPTIPGTLTAAAKESIWEHPLVRFGGGLLAGAGGVMAMGHLQKEEYKRQRDLQRERLEAQQVYYRPNTYRRTPYYSSVIGG